jgi:hypothetical protein
MIALLKKASAFATVVLMASTAAACANTNAEASPTASTSIDCADPNVTQSQWVAHCAATSGTPPASATTGGIGIGVPFPQAYQDSLPSGETPTSVQITVMALRCGIASFPFKAESGSGDIPNDVPAAAASGKQFCEATLTVRDNTNLPMPDGFDVAQGSTLTAGGADYIADPLSSAITFTINDRVQQAGGNPEYFSGDVLNPGDSATQKTVWQIPIDVTATAINFANPAVTVAVS